MQDTEIKGKQYGSRKSKQEWAEINGLWDKSKKPKKAFCAEIGVRESSFSYWRGRLKKESLSQSAEVATFAIAKPKALPLTNAASPVKIHYPNGIVLSLYCELTSPVVAILKPLLGIEPCL